MSEQIKECPYCGDSENVTISANPSQVWCESCGAEGPESNNEEDAVLLWNAAANQLEAKDAEIARLDAAVIRLEGALSETEDNRHKAVIDLSMAKRSVAAGDKRQDALENEIAFLNNFRLVSVDRINKAEAEIEQLRNDLRLRGDERTAISIGYIEATEECDKLREERDDAIAKYTEDHRLYLQASDKWREDYWKVKDELSKTKILLDEARAWARKYYKYLNTLKGSCIP